MRFLYLGVGAAALTMNYVITALMLSLALLAACTAPSAPSTTGNAIAIDAEGSPAVRQLPPLPDGDYALDAAASSLRYDVSKIASNPHTGNVAIKSGSLVIEDGIVTEGDYVVDLTKITEDANNERYLKHIRSADFFDIEKFPTSQFIITDVTPGTGGYAVTGDLTIKDITKELTFPATVEADAEGLRVKAKFTINRLDWNMTYASGTLFQQLGDKAIKDEIGYEFSLVFVQS